MSIARLQIAVAAAERELTASRASLDERQAALRHRVRDVWVPRALVVGGAATGFWIEGRLREPRGVDQPEGESEHASGGIVESSPSVAGLAVWLAMAESLLRLVSQLKPLLTPQPRAEAHTHAEPSSSAQEEDALAHAAQRGVDVDAWR